MLETEAKQTPGIRRSVDIIKARLDMKEGTRRGTSGEELRNMLSTNGVIKGSQLSGQALSGQELRTTGPGPQISEVTANTQHADQILMGEWNNEALDDTEMGVPGQWMDWSGFGFGGGFVPDTESFTFYDNFWGPEGKSQ